MKKIEVKGSYYEIGQQIGEILLEERNEGYPPRYSKEILEKSHAYEEQMKIYCPDLLEEFRGLADKLDIDFYVPLTLEATPYRFQTSSCFTMAISGEHMVSGLPVLVRNHEWMERDSKNLKVCYTEPKDKLRSVGLTFHCPLISRYSGVNEAGLALSMNSASFSHSGPGIMLNLAVRWMLDNCKTTKEAVAYLEKIPKVWGETYIIIDKNNIIAKVESHSEKTKVTYSDNGFELNTLMYDSPDMQQYIDQQRIDNLLELSLGRKNFASKWFNENKGNITDSMIQDVLKSHEHRMCHHEMEGLEICWSVIMKTIENESLICGGRPCKNEFQKIQTY